MLASRVEARLPSPSWPVAGLGLQAIDSGHRFSPFLLVSCISTFLLEGFSDAQTQLLSRLRLKTHSVEPRALEVQQGQRRTCIAKCWFANSLGTLTVFPFHCAISELSQAISDQRCSSSSNQLSLCLVSVVWSGSNPQGIGPRRRPD